MGFSPFELNRIAARASVPEPKYARQPIGPDYGRMIHWDLRSTDRLHALSATSFLPAFVQAAQEYRCKASILHAFGVVLATGLRSLVEERLNAPSIESFAFDSAPTGCSLYVEVAASRGMSDRLRNIFLRKRGDRWFFTSLFRILLMVAPVDVRLLRERSSGATPGMPKARRKNPSVS
jgi:hypothetical protein